LINRVVPGFDLLGEAVELAEALATKPPLTLAAALAAIHRGMDASIDDGLAIEEAAFARIVPTHECSGGCGGILGETSPDIPRPVRRSERREVSVV
jgi:enoyl-CoA hydratase